MLCLPAGAASRPVPARGLRAACARQPAYYSPCLSVRAAARQRRHSRGCAVGACSRQARQIRHLNALLRGVVRRAPMSTLQVSKLESLILKKICSLEYVSRVGYSDDGQEVTILVIHDDDRKRDLEILCGIGDRGIEIEDELPDRMIVPLAIQDGDDLPEGILIGSKVIYEREAKQ